MRFLILLSILSFSIDLCSQENSYKIKAFFDIDNKEINIKQSLKFINKSNIKLSHLLINDWANSYSNSKSSLGKRLSEEYSLSFQRSTKNQRGFTNIKNVYGEQNIKLNYQRLENHTDIVKIDLPEILEIGDSVTLNIEYKIKIPQDNFTGSGINRTSDRLVFHLLYDKR